MGNLLFSTKAESLRPASPLRLAERIINRAYIPCFMLALTFNINGLIDSLLAGMFFSPLHIAAIGIVLPVHLFFSALLHIFVQGTYVNYTAALGRGQRRKSIEIFTAGLVYIVFLGLLFSSIAVKFAPFLVRISGADDAALSALAIQYLRFTAPAYTLTAFTRLITLILGVYGFKRDTLWANIVNLVCNVVFSALFLRLVPEAGIGALGLGTLFAAIPTTLVCYVSARRRKLPVKLALRLAAFRSHRFKAVVSSGYGGPINDIVDGLVSVLINRIIVSSALGLNGLAAYSVVHCFWMLARVSAEGMDYAFAPLVNLSYVSHDRSGLKKVFTIAAYQGLADIVVWVLVIFAASPVLLKLYLGLNGAGTELLSAAKEGLLIVLSFSPALLLTYLLVCFFDYTERMDRSLLLAIGPDSVLFPILLVLLIPALGYRGIWLAMGSNTLIWLVMTYLIRAVRDRKLLIPIESLLYIDGKGSTQVPEFNFSIRSTDSDVSDLSEKVQAFLKREGASSKISYLTALCVDELATDIVAVCRTSGDPRQAERSLIDITVIAEEDFFNVLIRNIAKPYNPLDFEYENGSFSKVGLMMVQRIASKIDYNYIYKMNMINIRIDK